MNRDLTHYNRYGQHYGQQSDRETLVQRDKEYGAVGQQGIDSEDVIEVAEEEPLQQDQPDPAEQQLLPRIEQLERQLRVHEQNLLARKYTNVYTCVSITVGLFVLAIAGIGAGTGLTAYYNLSSSEQMKHATYVVIGSKYCGINASHIYTGMTVGFKTDTGTNFQCMPTDEKHVRYYGDLKSNYTNSTEIEEVVYGRAVKYKTFREENNLIASCALCRIDGREAIETLPATYVCGDSWTKQHEGYLMTGGICVHAEMEGKMADSNLEYITLHHEVLSEGGGNSTLFHSVYKDDYVLSCVVCSK